MPPPPSHKPLSIGLVFETFDTYVARPGDPPDAHAEYEPLATVELLERAVEESGHASRRLGSPHAVLAETARGSLAGIDAVWNIAEGQGSRNREAWARCGIPTMAHTGGGGGLGGERQSHG